MKVYEYEYAGGLRFTFCPDCYTFQCRADLHYYGCRLSGLDLTKLEPTRRPEAGE